MACKPRIAEAEYLALERASESKHEYVDGEALAMAGGSLRHGLVATNLAAALNAGLRARPCVVLSGDVRVHVQATGAYFHPELTVVCGGARVHAADPAAVTNPTVVFEVLSASTEAYDRGAKFAHLRSVTSLKEYVLVAQREHRVDHYRRLESGQWVLTSHVAPDATIPLAALDCSIEMHEIYAKTDQVPADGDGPDSA